MSWWEFAEFFSRPRVVDWTHAGFLDGAPVADIGPGSGENLTNAIVALPGTRFVAIEPDAGARAVLAQRIAGLDGARERVTIVPKAVQDVSLPQLGGAIATGVFYFMGPTDRHDVWTALAAALRPGAPVVLEAADANHPTEPQSERLIGTEKVGDLVYERWFSQRPLDAERVELVNTFRVRDGENLTREESCVFHTWVLSDAAKRREAMTTGCFVEAEYPGNERYTRLIRR